ncbi:HET-domain-containing protein [Apiospora saccharicola]|uniref:HET-domain-containing protein n=1 Tax=Apiospora saccharicola TaxID=335842 RepID=A0ABR1VAV4_9PEZI
MERRIIDIREEMPDKMHGLPVYASNFNRLFRDATRVTLDLGYKYIWIDSLCILQPEENAVDWTRECPSMGEYYANADLTLSATGFRDGKSGLFGDRDLREHGWATATTKTPWRLSYFREMIRRGTVNSPSSKTTPVFGRVGNWVNKFGKHSAEPFAREQQMKADPFPDNAEAYQKAWGGRIAPEVKLGGLDDSNDTAMNNWYIHVVHPYSAARLTDPGDKLPAISGVAAAYRKFLGDATYVAGHWSRSLLYTLAWRVSTAQSGSTAWNAAGQNRRAPSWSWSSVFWYLTHCRPKTVAVIPSFGSLQS